ncbi:MAG: anion transporter [Deferrisomatales bacterium]
MTAALVVFLLTYAVIAGQKLPLLHLDRPSGAMAGAVLMVWCGVLTQEEAVRAIHFDTILLLLGMMILAGYLSEGAFFRWCAQRVVRLARTPRGLLLGIVFVSGMLSALFVNDTICVMLTPLLLQVCDEADLPPLPFLLALATAANVGSVATLTGNPQNMIVGTHSAWSYGGFAVHMVPIALGGLAIDWLYLRWHFRQVVDGKPFRTTAAAVVGVDRPLVAKGILVMLWVLAGFGAGHRLSGVAMAGATAMVLLARIPPARVLSRVDWSLLLFFGGLFVVVEGLNRAGWGEAFFRAAAPLFGQTPGVQLATLSGFTVVLSNVVSNVPLVLVAVPWIPRFADPPTAWLALAAASTFAGNLTLVGSVANLIVAELAKTHVRMRFRDFLSVGVPVTLLTTGWALAVLWTYQALG